MMNLSERLDDIPLLVDLFVNKDSKSMGKKIDKIGKKVVDIFLNYSWPGNVRELQNTIERMMHFVNSNELTEDLIPKEIRRNEKAMNIKTAFESLEDIELQLLQDMIGRKLSKSEIAKRMKISRTTLYRKLEKYGL